MNFSRTTWACPLWSQGSLTVDEGDRGIPVKSDVMWETQPSVAGFKKRRAVWGKESRWLEAGKEKQNKFLPRASRKEQNLATSLTYFRLLTFRTTINKIVLFSATNLEQNVIIAMKTSRNTISAFYITAFPASTHYQYSIIIKSKKTWVQFFV